jgi:ribosomal protein S27AE
MILSCPNCSAIWTMEEIDEQHCGACGWPDEDNEDYGVFDDE